VREASWGEGTRGGGPAGMRSLKGIDRKQEKERRKLSQLSVKPLFEGEVRLLLGSEEEGNQTTGSEYVIRLFQTANEIQSRKVPCS